GFIDVKNHLSVAVDNYLGTVVELLTLGPDPDGLAGGSIDDEFSGVGDDNLVVATTLADGSRGSAGGQVAAVGQFGEFGENGQRVTAFFFQIGNGALNPGGIFQVDHFVGIAAYPHFNIAVIAVLFQHAGGVAE